MSLDNLKTARGSLITRVCHFSDVATEVSVWEGIAVAPLDRAYERPPDRKEGEGEEDMEGEPDTMETGD